MKNNKVKSVIILTGLPFKKHGNQSLIRFVSMFLREGVKLQMFSSGSDSRGENVILDPLFSIYKTKSISILTTVFLNNLYSLSRRTKNISGNVFMKMKSEEVIPAYGKYNFFNLINKWIKFIFQIIDNVILFFNLILFHQKKIRHSSIIIGYEGSYTFCSKWISKVFKKKYINKFQGVVALQSTNGDMSKVIKYYPHKYFSINKSDLCIMVNDGTGGDFYAKRRGCENILFITHGVKKYKHKNTFNNLVLKLSKQNKFILFNNATNSIIKRTDRIIRGMSKLPKSVLENVILLTTYHAEDKDDLLKYSKKRGLGNNIIFIEKIDSIESDYILQNSDVAIMTNDFSNLGNPILGAIYYKIPIISIDNGSLDGFVTNSIDSLLIKLNSDFDKNMAKAISRYYKDKQFYNKCKNNMNKNNQVRELSEQQEREFKVIEKLLNK